MKLRWTDRFIIAAIAQGAIITVMSLVIVAVQITNSEINIIQFLSLSFEGTAKWFFLGIIFHLIVIVAIAVTALFYNHLEITLKKRFSKVANALAAIHLIGMNVGGAGAMMVMTFAGLAGTGLTSVITEGTLGAKKPCNYGLICRANRRIDSSSSSRRYLWRNLLCSRIQAKRKQGYKPQDIEKT